ncbi:MAG TPA: hypothetical protein VGR37_22705 [Longimicrobiaceae bacterium]|nr:hypothetical protein [Longimicrobiaceae bacterium]
MSVNVYTGKAEKTAPPSVSYADIGQRDGPRMYFGSVDGWVEVKGAGTFKDAPVEAAGIFTTGQFICIAVTLVEWIGVSWRRARMGHINSVQASLVADNAKGFFTGYTDVDGANLRVVIGSKTGLSIGVLLERLRQNLPQLREEHVWHYQVNTAQALGSAVSADGFFGEPPA